MRALIDRCSQLDREESDQALPVAQAAVQAARALGATAVLVEALERHALVLVNAGLPEQALALVREGCEITRSAALPVLQARLRSLQAELLLDLGQERVALDEGLAALQLADSTGDVSARCDAGLRLGFAYRTLELRDTARELFRQVADLAGATANRYREARALNNMANCDSDRGIALRAAGDEASAVPLLQRALPLYQNALTLATAAGEHRLARVVRRNIGMCRSELGEHEAALAVFDEELTRAQQLRSPIGEEECWRLIGQTRLRQGRHAEAVQALLQARTIAQRHHRGEQEMTAEGLLADCFEACGDLVQAFGHLRRYQRLRDRSLSDANERRARAVAFQLETAALESKAEAAHRRAELLERSNAHLATQAHQLYKASHEDPLTGLPNRRRLELIAEEDLSRRDGSQPFSVCLIDIDHFKGVNDSYSHLLGDEVLRQLGRLLQQLCRQHDLPVRYGGEEFAVVFARAEVGEAAVACERIRVAVESHSWHDLHPQLKLTVSIGVADNSQSPTLQGLFELVDQRLYAAKRAGRNRVVAG